MLLEMIQSDLKEALKSKDQLRVSVLRFLLAAIQNREIEKQQELTDEEVISVIQKQVKERKESIEAFKQGKREDLARKEEDELGILNKYLPQQMSVDELKKIVEETVKESGASGPDDFGKVMGNLMPKIKGRADGQMVAGLVKDFLNR